jgi:hypothetical protein
MSKFVLNETKSEYINYEKSGGLYFPAKPVKRVDKLPAGVYQLHRSMSGDLFVKGLSATSDELIDMPNFTSQQIINEINKFWEPEVRARYEKRGIVYKRGFLLHGKHGTGKTSIIFKLMQEQIEQGNLIFFCPSPSDLSEFVKIVRGIEGDRRVLVVYEEFEKLLYSQEADFLSILDGEMQIDNIAYVATTNYIHKIPPRIKDRPSRFATVIEIGLPNADTRRRYIEAKTFPEENVNLNAWTKATEGLTIDQIKDLIISVYCIGLSLEEAVDRTKNVIQDSNEDSGYDPYNTYENDDWDLTKPKNLMDVMKNAFTK